MLSEFDLIKQYFQRQHAARPGTVLGIGDDCALLQPAPGRQLAISSDMLVEGRHFFAGADARLLGHKSLAVNLSDLAAMGARPTAFTLALALPEADPKWLAGFSEGLFALADAFDCELIGGDTTKGPLTICITIFGDLAPGQALRRAAAQIGDDVWISGTLGDARLALGAYWNEQVLTPAELAAAAPRMHMPTPRVALGRLLAEGGLAARRAGYFGRADRRPGPHFERLRSGRHAGRRRAAGGAGAGNAGPRVATPLHGGRGRRLRAVLHGGPGAARSDPGGGRCMFDGGDAGRHDRRGTRFALDRCATALRWIWACAPGTISPFRPSAPRPPPPVATSGRHTDRAPPSNAGTPGAGFRAACRPPVVSCKTGRWHRG